jgi:hypothetical protein
MTRARLAGALVAAAAFAGSVGAQPKAPSDPMVAQAEAIIVRAAAQGLFVPIASAAGPSVRHLKSGMICHFDASAGVNQIQIFDAGSSRGDDVGCGSQARGVTSTIFATRAANDADMVRQETQSLADIKRNFPDATEYKGPVATTVDKTRPPVAMARLVSPRAGRYMRVITFKLGNWVYGQTIIAPAASALQADEFGETQLSLLIKEVRAGAPR